MQPCNHSSAKGLSGRADLLRLLATAPRPELLLDDDGEYQFKYRQEDNSSAPEQTGNTKHDASLEKSTMQTGHFKLPLQMPFVHVIAERQTREPPKQAENPDQNIAVYDTLSEDDAKSPSTKRLIDYQDLVPKARLLPALKRYLISTRSAGLDVPLLVKQVAGQQLPRHLPRRQRKTWPVQWVVVLDFAKRLWPYRQDMHQLAEYLLQACGLSGVSIRIMNHGPLQHWTDWVDEQRSCGVLPAKKVWIMPSANTPVLLVSDLGLLEGADSAIHQAWQTFIRQLGKAGSQPLALVPLGAEQLDGGLSKNLSLLRWSPDSRFHPEHSLGKEPTVPEGLLDLLAMAAVTRRVDPPLLRAMRKLNSKAPLNAGLEGAFWCHADVEAGSAANIRFEAQAKHLEHFAQGLKEYHLELDKLRYRHHAHLRAVLNHEESLLWRANLELDDAELSPEAKQRLVDADIFMHKLAATLNQTDGMQKGGVWWTVAQDLVQRADNVMGERYFKPLIAAIAAVRGEWRQPPDWIDPADVVDPTQRKTQLYWLVRDPAAASIILQATPPTRHQSLLTQPLPIDQGGLRIENAGVKLLLSLQQQTYRLCGLQEEVVIKLITSQESLVLTSVRRPRGAMSWGCDASGPWLKSAALCNQAFEWSFRPIPLSPPLQTKLTSNGQYQLVENLLSQQIDPRDIAPSYISYHNVNQPAAKVRFVLDEFGVRADLHLFTQLVDPIQTLRWIEPGTFQMGSPDDEPERFDNEGPQHEVTISQGFWLADTACTQALWQAVMGNNPSYFKDNLNLPVEQISWHDVQEFLQRLQTMLPGCQVDLPSEAEWEYACRAGTTTPFSFGATINPQQVNYDGNYPYADGKKGEYRGKTIPVKSLPANLWGLYEVHGNVWEWCKDGERRYDEQAQIDPVGPLTGNDRPRAVRGGSWRYYAWWVRSALRYASLPGFAIHSLGFRFCLRSIQPGQVTDNPAGSPGSASGASQATGKKVDKSKKSSLKSKLGSIFKPGSKPKS